jgi:5'-AMP-activated protein kinase catalytic alpha subunit
LKLENVLLTEEKVLKICDFGFAAPFEGRDGSGLMRTFVGTYQYMAPELYLGLPYDGKKADVFSCGIMLYIMVIGRPPFRYALDSD